MEKDQLKCLYQQAKTLYVMKEYENVLLIIDALLQENSDRRSLVYLKIKCLKKLGLLEEARQIFEGLLPEYQQEKESAPCEEKSVLSDLVVEKKYNAGE